MVNEKWPTVVTDSQCLTQSLNWGNKGEHQTNYLIVLCDNEVV